MGELRAAFRALLKDHRFTAAAAVMLALGVGANAAIFSLVDALVLHPFPRIAEPDRVVWLFEQSGKVDLERDDVEAANFADWRAQAKTVSAFGALRLSEVTLTGAGDAERLSGQSVTAGYFDVLGLHPARGRFFTPDEEQPGRAAVAVMGYGLWQRRFGGDPSIIGRAIEVNGRATTVIGILPDGFMFPRAADLILPLALTPAEWNDRSNGAFAAFGRIAPGVTLDEAAAELDVIAGRLAADRPETNRDLSVSPVPLGEVFSMRGAMTTLLCAVGFLLLIACANVANLLLARGAARRRELAVRHALGASRGRLVRQLLVETLVLALIGAGLGLVIATFGVDALVAAIPGSFAERIPIVKNAAVNGEVVLFAAGLAVAITIVVGLIPALRSSQLDLTTALKEGQGGSTGAPRRRLMAALVVVEAALATMLLSGAGVTMRSFSAYASRPLGFRTDGVYTLRLPLEARHPDLAGRARFADRALDRLGALGEVALTSAIPSTENGGVAIAVLGREPPSRAEMPIAHVCMVSPAFFEVLGLPISRGRGFTRADAGAGEPTIVISASAARRLFGEGGEADAVGRRVHLGEDLGDRLIVGVAGDVPSASTRSTSIGEVYLPYTGDPSTVILAVRAADTLAAGSAARAALRELDPQQVVEHPALLAAVVDEQIAAPRLIAWIVGLTSAIALILAALGVYGLTAYAVGQRTREIGIRIALGAPAPLIVRETLRRTLLLIAAGMILGLLAWLPLGRLAAAVLYLPAGVGITPTLGALGVFAGVAGLAGLIPARRAARVDPMIALRAE